MVKIKLTYFNVRGRGEVARLLLHHAGKKFEDYRLPLPFEEEGRAGWIELKPTLPWGTLPVMEYGGLVLGQSLAINR